MTSNDDYVLEVLKEQGRVTQPDVEQALTASLGQTFSAVDILVRDEIVGDREVLEILAAQFGMEMIDLEHMQIPLEIRELINVDTARRYRVVPVFNNETSITFALSDPLDYDTVDSLKYLLNKEIMGVVTTREDIDRALDKYYAIEANVDAMLDQISDGTVDVDVSGTEDMAQDVDATDSDAPIIKLVSLIILEAYKNRASDIHLEPMDKRFRVRYRIDGVLHEVDSPPKRLQSSIISRVKIMATMKISEKRKPQDGRIQVNILGRELDLRVSSVPTNHGESIVMRILDKQNLALGLPKLGFFSDDQATFEKIISLADGIMLVTGPTGSGKTTTLYACLGQINKPDRKIITVENPVEYQMTGVNQVQVRAEVGLTFSSALRSILRQAPNIVMIGEIRDLETAQIATEAALTGHLVFSTLHTNDAPSAITRMLDIGVKPFLVASSIRGILGQRLCRNICDSCKEEYTPTENELSMLGPAAEQMMAAQLFKGRGCNKCGMSGYTGRKGIFEIFVIDDEIQRLIFEEVSAAELRTHAREAGMRTMREDGVRKIIAGVTTIEEVLRVTMGDTN